MPSPIASTARPPAPWSSGWSGPSPTPYDPDQLRAYGEVVRAFADRVDAETIDAAARTLVEEMVRAIPNSIDPDQLRAYGEVVRAFADRISAETIDAAARTLVEQVVRAIPTL